MSDDVTVSGPLFDGSLESALRDMEMSIRDTVAAQASADWHARLDENLQHPTPYYETQLNTMNTSDSTARVNDRHIIYGPWLEGLGSRNYPRTVFRGYHSLRSAIDETESKVAELVRPIVDRFVERMGGDR